MVPRYLKVGTCFLERNTIICHDCGAMFIFKGEGLTHFYILCLYCVYSFFILTFSCSLLNMSQIKGHGCENKLFFDMSFSGNSNVIRELQIL